jgi:hypothetical protein
MRYRVKSSLKKRNISITILLFSLAIKILLDRTVHFYNVYTTMRGDREVRRKLGA